MGRTISIGNQSFADIREHGDFMVDKTSFIREWWDARDQVTLITRPRRFGKTFNLSMLEAFFSTKYAGRADLFAGLNIWADEEMRALQGTLPVIFLSFADIKEGTFESARAKTCRVLADAFKAHADELGAQARDWDGPEPPYGISPTMDDATAASSIKLLCSLLERKTGKRPIVLLDEYDTPMQEAWTGGFWDKAVGFMRPLLNSTFKTNPSLERGLLTGITRVSKESIFSDLNNLRVVTTTTEAYETSFGFTEDEVFAAMDEMGRTDEDGVKQWYDGFVFGRTPDIYNPWSVVNYLKEGALKPYWANTSANGLVSSCIAQGDKTLKEDFRTLLDGGSITRPIDEQVVFSQLAESPDAVWSLLLASGYLKCTDFEDGWHDYRTLTVTNLETLRMLERTVGSWFAQFQGPYGEFCRAMLEGDAEAMDAYLSDVAHESFSHFDTGRRAAECFYHGFVLGLVVDLRGRYLVQSNRESGFGRFDVALVPCNPAHDPGIILEFKTCSKNQTLEEAGEDALTQIANRQYCAGLIAQGVPAERIHTYGIAFQGKKTLVMKG